MDGWKDGLVYVCVRACMHACRCAIDTFGDRLLGLRRGGCVVVRCNSVVVTVVIAAVCDGYAHAAVSISQLASE